MPNARSCSDWRLYVILDPRAAAGRDLARIAELAIRGGADALQLRDKHGTARDALDQARRILAAARPSGVPLLINDRVDLAIAAEADGVHLGQDDLPLAAARRLLGKDRLIGVSTHSLEQARAADLEPVDYLAIGPVFATPTKPDYGQVGLPVVTDVAAAARHPVVAIGGIDAANVGRLADAGARCVAVVRAVCAADDPESAARQIKQALTAGPGGAFRAPFPA